jgi:hypothetical protein
LLFLQFCYKCCLGKLIKASSSWNSWKLKKWFKIVFDFFVHLPRMRPLQWRTRPLKK